MAARAVWRINVPAPVGDGSEWGAGFLIGPRLLLTNNHVIGSPEDALKATVEFGYELDAEGRLKRTTRFRLSPQDGFVTSPKEALDYTIVAIAESSEDGATPISDFGFLRLDARTGKTEVGQYATIIQHPDAKTKRISLRENKFVKYGDDADPERDNFSGTHPRPVERGNDVWYYDPRVPEELQNGDELYGNEPVPSKNYFDRGHLVRRLDPVWGDVRVAKQANDDTFQWTNCSPQYWGFNQGADLWQSLENFVLYNTDEENVQASVFSGPLFRSDDEEHRGILIPQFFWKVVAVTDKNNKLYTSAYMVSQQDYALDIPFERLPVGPNSTKPGQNFQVPVTKIVEDTGIMFADVVRNADVYSGPPTGRTLRTVADIQHPRR